jgi:multiple sugar transport system permease protein
VVFQLVAGLVLALLINQRLRGIRIFRICVLFPYLVPTVVAVYTYKWLLDPSLGVYTYILDAIGVSISPFATGTAMATVILITFWKYVPFAAIMILARLMVIPKDLQEAAEIDGASPLSKVRYIILPQLKYVLMATALLRTIWLFREFDIIWLTTGGGPLHATETLPVVAYIYAFQTYDLGLGSAVAVILFIIVFIFTIAYLKVSERL